MIERLKEKIWNKDCLTRGLLAALLFASHFVWNWLWTQVVGFIAFLYEWVSWNLFLQPILLEKMYMELQTTGQCIRIQENRAIMWEEGDTQAPWNYTGPIWPCPKCGSDHCWVLKRILAPIRVHVLLLKSGLTAYSQIINKVGLKYQDALKSLESCNHG